MAALSRDPVARVLRLFTLLNLIASRLPGRRLGRKELAQACECSVKTIARDLELLQAARIPLEYDKAERAFFLPDKGWAITTSFLSASDVTALSLSLSLFACGDLPSALSDQLEVAIDKVSSGLSPHLRGQMQQIHVIVHRTGGSARDYSQAPLECLVLAARRQQTVEVYYDSAHSGTVEWRKIDPYRLDHRLGRYWEIQAWCHRELKVKTFSLDGVLDARLTDDRFERQPWDDSDEGVFSGLRDGEWVDVEVRFAPEAVRYARKRRWPFDATFEPQPDGGVVMRGRVRGLDGILCELLSWRRLAVVLGGPELRERMAEEIRAMASCYSEPEKS